MRKVQELTSLPYSCEPGQARHSPIGVLQHCEHGRRGKKGNQETGFKKLGRKQRLQNKDDSVRRRKRESGEAEASRKKQKPNQQ
ncbi:hypothetical protein RRG08_033525 [Elysia crispata]|uniref:Uncharacterized protein n=1 Tax=Elysia crispata TaxID=231223 RepID=A0AAE0XNT9_9GAST|nr:hypothetical protein RRG08_033525 [Elysia crispata]